MSKTPPAPEDPNNTNVGLENIGDLDTILNGVKSKVTNESGAVASPEDIDNTIKAILLAKKIPPTQDNYNKALLSTAHLVQIGATSPKFAATRIISDYGLDIKAGDLRDACNKNGTTVRKYARGIRNTVIKVASNFGLEGNLAKSYKLENPGCDRQDLIWASDFQTFSDNEAMPESVKLWLLDNYRRRFKPNS